MASGRPYLWGWAFTASVSPPLTLTAPAGGRLLDCLDCLCIGVPVLDVPLLPLLALLSPFAPPPEFLLKELPV